MIENKIAHYFSVDPRIIKINCTFIILTSNQIPPINYIAEAIRKKNW